MSAAAPAGGPGAAAEANVGAAAAADEPGRLRLRTYAMLLLGALGLQLVVHGLSGGLLALALLLLVGAALVAALLGGRRLEGLLGPLAALAAALALAVPLGPLVLSGQSLPAAVRATAVWPQALVALFAARVLAELTELRFAAFWRDPLGRGGRARAQSLLAALFGGAALTLLFLQLLGGFAVDPASEAPAAITLRALLGETAIHAAILFLFFVALAAIADAALASAGDGAVLAAFRRLVRAELGEGARPTRGEISRLAATRLSPFPHSRAAQAIREAAFPDDAALRATGRSLAAVHLASRRFVRALISFLPLIGFLGTVIGLTAAIGGLPSQIGPGASADLDIGASLLGLALKFETTLLGLLGGLLATLLLSLLEKRESETAAECRHLVEAARDG